MNETQTKALDALEKALPYLEIADKLSERDDFEQEIGKNGHPTACRTQDALYNAKLAIKGLKAMEKDYDDTELEDRVFLAASEGGGGPAMTEQEYKQLIRDLWTAYCEMEGRYIAVQEQYDAIEYRE